MDLFNTISCAVAAAYEAVANRNRQAAVNNRLKAVVRSELATINRAYIALGKHFYNDLRSGSVQCHRPGERENPESP